MEHRKTPAIAHSCPTLHLGHLVHRNVLMTSLYQTLATPIAAQERTTSSWKKAKQFSGEIGLTGLLQMCWPFFSAQKSMSFLTESEAASMGFRKEGSLIATLTVCRARLRCFTRSRVSLAQAILWMLFWGGVHQTVHHMGAHPCNLNQLHMDAKNQNASVGI